MHEDLWKELGLINTVYLAIYRREQELTSASIPGNFFNPVPPQLSTAVSKTQHVTGVLAHTL